MRSDLSTMKRLICIFLLLIAWLMALSPSLATADQMLCLGRDGHVAVEVKSLSRCIEHPEGLRAASSTTAPDELHQYAIRDATHCGGCVDLEISRLSVTRGSHAIPLPKEPVSKAPKFFTVVAAATVWTERICSRERPGIRPVLLADPILAERRTVSLLI